MPTFEYQAKGAEGQVIKGVVFGVTLDHALRELSSGGVQVLQIGVATNPHDPLADVVIPTEKPVEQSSTDRSEAAKVRLALAPETPVSSGPSTEQRSYMATSVWGPLVGKVPLKELGFFFRQLSTMLEAGVPIVQSLTTLATQAKSQKFSEVLHELVGHVNAGRGLSDGLQRYPEVFSPVMLSLIRAGEQGGFLDEALGVIADYIDREIALRNLYRRVTFMPKLEVGASILIVIATNLIIAGMGKSGGLWSPLTEPIVWVFLAPFLVALFLFFRVGLANPRIKYNWDVFVSKVPYVGTTFKQLSMAKFGRAFGALYKGGVPVHRALTISADACGNEYLRALMHPAYRGLESGTGIAETFKNTEAFSPIVIDMVATGEQTGNLDLMLNKMAAFYEDEAATRATQTAQVVGLVCFICVAIYIGFVVITFWTSYASGATAPQ